MKHKHHIIPRYMGGNNLPDNIIELSIEEHANAHKVLYEQLGNKEDYIAWKALENSISKEQIISLRCSLGGKIGGRIQKELGLGIHAPSFTSPEIVKQNASKAGKKAFQLGKNPVQIPNKASSMGKTGGPKNKGFIWYNDGYNDFKYTYSQQLILPLYSFLQQNTQFRKGRIPINITCPHCGTSAKDNSIYLHHFNRCPLITPKRSFKIKNKKTCPYCGKIGAGGVMTRFHFNNCKYKR